MTTFPIFQDRFRLNTFKRGELPLFITHYTVKSPYPLHHHEFVEISLVTGGRGTENVNGQIHELRPGSVCLLLPYHLHALELEEGGSLSKFCLMFDMKLLVQNDFDEVGRWIVRLSDGLSPFYDLQEEPFCAVSRVLSELNAEYAADRPGKQGWMRIKLLEAIYLFFRNHPGIHSTGNGGSGAGEEWEYIKYVHTHFMDEHISLEKMAAHFGVSVFVIRNAFKRLLGKNFLEYLHLLRIRRASSLLAATDMSVAEIAYDVGFSSLRSFTRVFKEVTGVSATDYRKLNGPAAK